MAYSIAARVAAGNKLETTTKMLFPEKWWTVPKGNHKVLYLDFENANHMEDLQSSFQAAYLPTPQACPDLIMKDMSSEQIDWTHPEHHQKLLDMIDDAKNEEKWSSEAYLQSSTIGYSTSTPSKPICYALQVNGTRASLLPNAGCPTGLMVRPVKYERITP